MYKKLGSKTILDHPRLKVVEDTIQLDSGQTTGYLIFEDQKNGVVIIAINAQREILLIEEYSYIIDKNILLLPMGGIKQDEMPEQAANRELQQETGFKAETPDVKGSYYQHHRRSSSKGIVVLASDLIESSLPKDDEEADTIKGAKWIPAKDLNDLIKNERIVDADTISALRLSCL
jgi:ADP-ribose pyrophosphatase